MDAGRPLPHRPKATPHRAAGAGAVLRRAGQFVALAILAACARDDGDWIADLDSPDPHTRGLAAIALALQSPEASAPALPVLLDTIDRSDAGLEREAAHALVLVGGHHVDALIDELLGDPLMTEHRRGALMNALVMAGPPAASLVVRRLGTDARELAGPLGEVLLGIGAPGAPALAELLDASPDPAVRRFAAFLLLRLGPGARAARAALERAASAEDTELAGIARQALANLRSGPGAARGGPR